MHDNRKLLVSAAMALVCGFSLQALANTPAHGPSYTAGRPPARLVLPELAPRPLPPERYGVFGSTALPAGRIMGAGDWQRVKHSVIAARPTACPEGVCASPAGRALFQITNAVMPLAAREVLDRVNRAVNSRIAYRAESGDSWATLAETARRGYGDCEDFAIAKMTLLRQAGFAPEDMQLVVLKDTRRQLYHAVVAVHVAGKRYILDNLSNHIATDDIFRSYRPIASYAGEQSYLHGFARKAPQLASAE